MNNSAPEITIDEKACVGCALCADICPTKVFEYSESDAVPGVVKAHECFGCLSCTEICPATAISHSNIRMSQVFYHDPKALALAKKTGETALVYNVIEEEESLKQAEEDLGMRLLSVASVLKQTLGQSLPAVGTMAGRSLATQLPRYQHPESVEDVLAMIVHMFSGAWEIEPELSDDKLTLTVGKCFIRDLCGREGISLGGDLCVLFYNYLAGYFNKISGIRPRLTKASRGQEQCVYEVKLYKPSS
ncbi:MAG: 4Fe-4S dicluster domain-containing protein [Chitinivibrionales bacterium]|nr:4Fe-4S dicluster domain-containing protein [Chitinivibrionales bacterium]